MAIHKPSLKNLLIQWAGEEAGHLDSHPTPEELEQFRGGDLSPDREAGVLDHLGVCRACADHLRARSASTIGSRSSAVGTGSPAGSGKRRFGAVFHRWLPEGASAPRLVSNLAVAAVLALLALSIWEWRRAEAVAGRWRRAEAKIAELSRPQVNVPILNVRKPTRDEAASLLFELGPGEQRFVMVLPVAGGYQRYELKIFAADGQEVWSSRELRPDDLGVHVCLSLSRDFLEPGDYRFQISGLKDGKASSMTQHRVTLRYR